MGQKTQNRCEVNSWWGGGSFWFCVDSVVMLAPHCEKASLLVPSRFHPTSTVYEWFPLSLAQQTSLIFDAARLTCSPKAP